MSKSLISLNLAPANKSVLKVHSHTLANVQRQFDHKINSVRTPNSRVDICEIVVLFLLLTGGIH